MISFEIPSGVENVSQMFRNLAMEYMRKWARWADDHEHERCTEWVDFMWVFAKNGMMGPMASGMSRKKKEGEQKDKHRVKYQNLVMAAAVEQMSWGDAGLYLSMPFMGLGGAAIAAVGTDEQKQRFLTRFSTSETPVWGAMAITEPGAGSDSAAIRATAELDEATNEWVINGEKIFVTQGKSAAEDSNGVVVVWATRDRSAGRAGMKSFVVEGGTPGMTVTKVEHKLGIRASDTASIVFEDCRIPFDHVLGDPEVKTGFKGAMATFDATRPMVAASAIGIGQASLERAKELYEENGGELRYGANPNTLGAAERDLMLMEAQIKVSRLLTWKAAWMADAGVHNNLEASVAKAKTGKAVTWVSNKAVEIAGPLGYSKNELLEKWLRDAKINDIFEGTGQINTLVVARQIFGLSSKELR
ncbi:MAG TPA: acyl-CoA dehydrogenase family protein [Deltaproteobacteria bacterium]|jgi:acyl-CoA dehydrogenase|nr:acyl-CoA dehydrogenase family protein [Deltaproteobacteria bacterium]HOI08171.1 acyl-CoA dehydrogenase family protein [Deltaproteobacteria bacterium]